MPEPFSTQAVPVDSASECNDIPQFNVVDLPEPCSYTPASISGFVTNGKKLRRLDTHQPQRENSVSILILQRI